MSDSPVSSCVSLMLFKDEHHLDHATDEEKLASSVSLRSDKEESGGYPTTKIQDTTVQ